MKKILLVDDEEGILFLISEELEEEGFAVDTAFNGEICLRKLEVATYDLVILDIHMPGMNGLHVALEIKLKLQLEMPIIIFSAYPEIKAEVEYEGHDYYIYDYIVKYIVKSANTEELINSVNKFLKD